MSNYYGSYSNGMIDVFLQNRCGTIKRKTLAVQTAEKEVITGDCKKKNTDCANCEKEIITEDYKKKNTGFANRGKGNYNCNFQGNNILGSHYNTISR